MSSSTGRRQQATAVTASAPTPAVTDLPLSDSPTAAAAARQAGELAATTLPAALPDSTSFPSSLSLLSQSRAFRGLGLPSAVILLVGINLEYANARGKGEGGLDTKGRARCRGRTQSLRSMGRRAGPGRRSGGSRPALCEPPPARRPRGAASRAASHNLKPSPPPSAPHAARSAPCRGEASRACRARLRALQAARHDEPFAASRALQSACCNPRAAIRAQQGISSGTSYIDVVSQPE